MNELCTLGHLHLTFDLYVIGKRKILIGSENEIRQWDVDGAFDAVGHITAVSHIDDDWLGRSDERLRLRCTDHGCLRCCLAHSCSESGWTLGTGLFADDVAD